MTTPIVAERPPTPDTPPPPAVLPRRRFTVVDYDAMIAAGILTKYDHVELLHGEIVEMPPIGEWHIGTTGWLNKEVVPAVGDSAFVSIQGALRLDSGTELVPDVLLLRPRADFYRSRKPVTDDVLLLIEVSDTSLAYDRGPKLAAYANAGVPEVWIANRNDRRVETYTEPAGGRYAAVRHFGPGQRIAPQAFPDLLLAVDDIIPADDDAAPPA